jgi:acetoin utilization protein AcuB
LARIADIMTRDVVAVSMDDTLADAAERLAQGGFHHLLVSERGRIVGVLSDRDVLRHTSPFVGKLAERTQDAATLRTRVHHLMSRGVVSVAEETSVGDAVRILLDAKVSCLPVLDGDGRARGIVTWRDLLRALAGR